MLNYNKLTLDNSCSICIYSLIGKLKNSKVDSSTFKLYEVPLIHLYADKKMRTIGPDSVNININDFNDIKTNIIFRDPTLYRSLTYDILYKYNSDINIKNYNVDCDFNSDFASINNYNFVGLTEFDGSIKNSKELLSKLFLIKQFKIETEIRYMEKKTDTFLVSINIQTAAKKSSDIIFFEVSLNDTNTNNKSFSFRDISNLMISIMKNRFHER